MNWRLKFQGFLTYGVAVARGKALAVIMLAAAPAWAEEVTVLALGDSLTQGYGLPEAQGFVPQLQGWLDAQGAEVALINGGVSGDTTAGGASRVDWSLTPEVDAMIVALGGNDLLRGIDPGVSRENLDKILAAAEAKEVEVLLVGMDAPGNYGPEYKAAFDGMYPELAEEYGTLYFESFFKGLGESDPAQARQYFQSDGIHPNAEGVGLIVEAMGPKVLDLIGEAE
uniref:arylesterase n=1 Tax=Roseovarius indicus TaxID=540747 RepID=UPI003B51D156